MERVLREILALCHTMNKFSSLKYTHTFYFPSVSLPSVSVSWFPCVKDKREGVDEVLQHWNPTSLSGQLLLLIMYAIFMHATFPMLAAWFFCLQLQTLGCVLSEYCGSVLQEGKRMPKTKTDTCLLSAQHICPHFCYLHDFLHGGVSAPVQAEHWTYLADECGNIAHRQVCACGCQDKYRLYPAAIWYTGLLLGVNERSA